MGREVEAELGRACQEGKVYNKRVNAIGFGDTRLGSLVALTLHDASMARTVVSLLRLASNRDDDFTSR
jgi:hypothetical protein